MAQTIERDGRDDDDPDQNLLHVVRDARQRAAVGQDAHQERADQINEEPRLRERI